MWSEGQLYVSCFRRRRIWCPLVEGIVNRPEHDLKRPQRKRNIFIDESPQLLQWTSVVVLVFNCSEALTVS